ncbi:MAG: Fic family protein [bacterium]
MTGAYQDYLTKAEIIAREKDSRKAEARWDELFAERQAKAEGLPLADTDGKAFWFVITPHLIGLISKIARHRGFLESVSLSPQVRKRLEKRAADLEAYFSSHIEGARSTLEEALAFMKTGKKRSKDESLQMIVNNRLALDAAAKHIGKPVNDEFICQLQSILTENTHRERPITRGEYRHGPIYVVNAMRQVVYEGPPAKMVPGMMRKFIAWLNAEQGLDPILKAGIAHLYFVQVHPFDDGNGRTARALSNLVLANAGLRLINMLALSDYFDHKRPQYYRAIQDCRLHGRDMTYFLIFYAEALLEKIEEVQKEIEVEHRIDNIKDLLPSDVYRRLHRRQIKALRLMFRSDEKMTTKLYCRLNKCSDETARTDFLSLVELNVIVPDGKGRSSGYVLSPKVIGR